MHSSLFVGIDVSQARLDVALRPGTSQTLSHDEAGIATLVEHLHGLDPTLIILEATGGLEVPLVSALAVAGQRSVRVRHSASLQSDVSCMFST